MMVKKAEICKRFAVMIIYIYIYMFALHYRAVVAINTIKSSYCTERGQHKIS